MEQPSLLKDTQEEQYTYIIISEDLYEQNVKILGSIDSFDNAKKWLLNHLIKLEESQTYDIDEILESIRVIMLCGEDCSDSDDDESDDENDTEITEEEIERIEIKLDVISRHMNQSPVYFKEKENEYRNLEIARIKSKFDKPYKKSDSDIQNTVFTIRHKFYYSIVKTEKLV